MSYHNTLPNSKRPACNLQASYLWHVCVCGALPVAAFVVVVVVTSDVAARVASHVVLVVHAPPRDAGHGTRSAGQRTSSSWCRAPCEGALAWVHCAGAGVQTQME